MDINTLAGLILGTFFIVLAILLDGWDIKPENLILCRSPAPRLTMVDLGLAMTRDGGTPAYLAPEVLDGRPPGPSADIYMAGLVLWELLHDDAALRASDLGVAATEALLRDASGIGNSAATAVGGGSATSTKGSAPIDTAEATRARLMSAVGRPRAARAPPQRFTTRFCALARHEHALVSESHLAVRASVVRWQDCCMESRVSSTEGSKPAARHMGGGGAAHSDDETETS